MPLDPRRVCAELDRLRSMPAGGSWRHAALSRLTAEADRIERALERLEKLT